MTVKFPSLWVERNGEACITSDGELTATAKNWASEIQRLNGEQIKAGIKDLAFLKNPSFPPTALEFVDHCLKWGAEQCSDEIMDYLNRSADDDFWWVSKTAFNVFKRLHYNPLHNEKPAQIKERILNVYKRLDWDNLDDIPPKPVALPVKEPTKVEKNKSKFQGKMFFAIMRSRPDLLGLEPCEKAKGLFVHQKSIDLMGRWYQQDQPDMVQFLRSEGIAV